MLKAIIGLISSIVLLPGFRNLVEASMGWFIRRYLHGVVFAVAIGFFLLIAISVGMPVIFITALGYVEAVLIAVILWIRAVTVDTEAEVRSRDLRGPARRRFQRERVRRAHQIANSSRQWAVVAMVVVFVYATSPRWLPILSNSPFANIYTTVQNKTVVLKRLSDRQRVYQDLLTEAQKRAGLGEDGISTAAETAYLRGANDLARKSLKPEE